MNDMSKFNIQQLLSALLLGSFTLAHELCLILTSSQHKDLLQLMIDATEGGEGGGGRKLTDEEIVAHSITFLVAGYETTSNLLAYTSYLLAVNPEIQEKLQSTIEEYFESNPVSFGFAIPHL